MAERLRWRTESTNRKFKYTLAPLVNSSRVLNIFFLQVSGSPIGVSMATSLARAATEDK